MATMIHYHQDSKDVEVGTWMNIMFVTFGHQVRTEPYITIYNMELKGYRVNKF